MWRDPEQPGDGDTPRPPKLKDVLGSRPCSDSHQTAQAHPSRGAPVQRSRPWTPSTRRSRSSHAGGAAMTPDLFGATPELASPAIGMTVKLDRDIDRQQPCHDNLAIIRPGKPLHSGELRCVTCNAHRGWLPQTVLNFIIETTRRFGALTEPIIVRQQHKENQTWHSNRNLIAARSSDRDRACRRCVRSCRAQTAGVSGLVGAGNRRRLCLQLSEGR